MTSGCLKKKTRALRPKKTHVIIIKNSHKIRYYIIPIRLALRRRSKYIYYDYYIVPYLYTQYIVYTSDGGYMFTHLRPYLYYLHRVRILTDQNKNVLYRWLRSSRETQRIIVLRGKSL